LPRLAIFSFIYSVLKKDIIMQEGPGRPLDPPRKMLIETTPGGRSAATPLERGKIRIKNGLVI
jgi:hypothetical protein